jgi:hypothetical protein
MEEWISSLTSMVVTHLAVDDCVLVYHTLALNPCSYIVYILLESENILQTSLPYTPTPPNSREMGQSSALAARTKKNDSNDRALSKFNIFVFKTLSMFIEKYVPS